MVISANITNVRRVATEILRRIGVPEADADIIADSMVYAHRRGKNTHGINRLPIYVRKIEKGLMAAETGMVFVKENPVISVFDAQHGFGQVAGYKGMNVCTSKAAEYGVGVVGIRNSNNFATAGYIAEQAVDREMIGIVLGNSAPAIAPWGGRLPLFGTNPLGIAFPGGSDNKMPVVLDMASSVAARGKIRLAVKNGEKIPFGWAVDVEGNPTEDPAKALLGTLLPIGEHKGYGLSLAIDILAGLLTGAAFGGEVKPLNTSEGFSNFGHLLIAINISFFMDYEEYLNKMKCLYSKVKECGGEKEVFLPGEISYKKMLENNGTVKIGKKQVSEINDLADKLGLDLKLG